MTYQLLDTIEHISTKKKKKHIQALTTYKSNIKYFCYFLIFQITKSKCTMSNNIIALVIFFPLHTFLILHIPRSPTTTHFEITSTRFGTTGNNSQQYPPHFLLFAFHLFLQYSLSLSLSLVNMCNARRKSKKNKPLLKQTSKTQEQQKISLNWSKQIIINLLIFGLLWFFLNII